MQTDLLQFGENSALLDKVRDQLSDDMLAKVEALGASVDLSQQRPLINIDTVIITINKSGSEG
jgi:hypothetical protein